MLGLYSARVRFLGCLVRPTALPKCGANRWRLPARRSLSLYWHQIGLISHAISKAGFGMGTWSSNPVWSASQSQGQPPKKLACAVFSTSAGLLCDRDQVGDRNFYSQRLAILSADDSKRTLSDPVGTRVTVLDLKMGKANLSSVDRILP